MKKLLFLSLLCIISLQAKNNKPLPQMPVVHEKNPDDQVNTELIVSNVAGILDGFSKIVPDPYNPVVVATSVTQIGVSFAKIIVEMFKNIQDMHAETITEEQVHHYFRSLPNETQQRLIALFIAYAKRMR